MCPAQSQSCADTRVSAFFPRGRTYSTSSTHAIMSYAHPIPRRYVLTAAIVFSGLALALFRLPLGTPAESAWWAQRGGSGTQAAAESGKIDRRGVVTWLNDVSAIPVNHDGSGALKQPLIVNGEVPNLMGLSVARFSPGDEVETHSHETMDEVFYGQEGKGIIEVEGNVVEMTPGMCVHVPAGQLHRIENTEDEDMVLLYFGIATEPSKQG